MNQWIENVRHKIAAILDELYWLDEDMETPVNNFHRELFKCNFKPAARERSVPCCICGKSVTTEVRTHRDYDQSLGTSYCPRCRSKHITPGRP
jgi:hypothetical protein